MLVYFPAFVLSVDTSSDCHLSYNPLGRSALLDTLQYVQPRCPPLLYPAKLKASSNTNTQSSRLIEDDKSKDDCSSHDVQDEAVVADISLSFNPCLLILDLSWPSFVPWPTLYNSSHSLCRQTWSCLPFFGLLFSSRL